MVSVLPKQAIVDPQTKLAQNRTAFTIEMNSLLKEGFELGATEGMQRLELICEQYDQLSPNTAYLWIDPSAIQREIEEAQTRTRRMEVVHVLRNCFSLLPLIATWGALFAAVYSYQQDLMIHQDDRLQPFLQLWQDGFHGATWFTVPFTATAITDVVLLACYLGCILVTHELERRASIKAVTFVQKMQHQIDELMKYIAEDGFKHVGDQSDIDKVVDAVKKVVDSATNSVKQTVESTVVALKQVVEQAANTNNQVIKDSANANKQVIENVEKSFEAAVNEAQQKMQKSVEASEKAVMISNNKVEKMFVEEVTPLMKAFRSDMVTFQKELGNYQTRLNDLTGASQQLANASQQLSGASQTLTQNAERYTTIGQDINTQIASLNMTQRDVVSQMGGISGNISTAAANMTSIASSMKNATTNVEVVAKQFNLEMHTTLQKMTTNVDSFTQSMRQGGTDLQATINSMGMNIGNISRSLEQVGTNLQATSAHLYNTAMLLEGAQRRERSFMSRFWGRRQRPAQQ